VTLPATYDAAFRRRGGRLPVAFLRALAQRESSFDANNATGAAWGLLQITEIARRDHNARHGTNHSRAALLDPEVNIEIGADLLERIVDAYGRHPSRNLQRDWSNAEFVKLVVAGWNSGYSEGGGVGRVASYLEARGVEVTHDAVFDYASAAGAASHLSNTGKRDWQRSVAQLYFEQPDAGVVAADRMVMVAALVAVVALVALG
jgi:soluble lytic murein transglycosylase-like protein